MKEKKPKVIIILGPTSVGKSALGVELANEFNGEIISADSRQIYRGLDLSTGKITPDEMQNIPHHLIDIKDPSESFSTVEFRERATEAIEKILNKKKVPIIVGGTGFFISTLVNNLRLPNVAPNKELRDVLEQLSTEELYHRLIELAPQYAADIDQSNRHRLTRAIEIATELGYIPKIESEESPYEFLQIGLILEWEQLREKIYYRTLKRIESGIIGEIKKIHDNGVSWERLEELGFDQKFVAQFLQGKLTEDEMKKKIVYGNVHYAKRQLTWFKRDERIKWFSPNDTDGIHKEVKLFLS